MNRSHPPFSWYPAGVASQMCGRLPGRILMFKVGMCYPGVFSLGTMGGMPIGSIITGRPPDINIELEIS